MTKETEVALAAIDALCGKKKAKALKKLVRKAIESERTISVSSPLVTYTDSTGTAAPHYSFTTTDGVYTT